MNVRISAGNETFLAEQIATGAFRDHTEAINAAVELLRKRTEILGQIDVGQRQLNAGEFTDYDETALVELFDGLRARASGASD